MTKNNILILWNILTIPYDISKKPDSTSLNEESVLQLAKKIGHEGVLSAKLNNGFRYVPTSLPTKSDLNAANRINSNAEKNHIALF